MKRACEISFLLLMLVGIGQRSFAGVFAESAHGDRLTGVMRDATMPRGSCRQCHEEVQARHPKGLWQRNDNELCFTCHAIEKLLGSYPGRGLYEQSSHGTDPRFVWPGPFPPARRELDMAGKCLNCHDPHGKQDRSGIIPSLLIARQESLCLSCHDGDPSAQDIARELRKPYRHMGGSGAHRADEAAKADPYAYQGGNRHVECSDCHNAHAVAGDVAVAPNAPRTSRRLARVSRVGVMNGGPGTVPRYVFYPANDTSTQVLEYEICYKCHSSWIQQPPGQEDIALRLNINNASFHPVEGTGRNLAIAPASFVNGMNAFSTISCSDCHGSDDSESRGPHGSQFPNLLRGAYQTRSPGMGSTPDDLCFRCHAFATYADAFSAPFQQEASRFVKHAVHVGKENIPCYACHESHGAPQYGALIATGRNPGLRTFTMTPLGGGCLPTCHEARTYTVAYPR